MAEADPCQLSPMALCTDSRVYNGQFIGDPTEGALWVLAQKGGVNPETEQWATRHDAGH